MIMQGSTHIFQNMNLQEAEQRNLKQSQTSVQNADRIIVLDNGVVNGFGTHEELLASNDIYRDVYESQTSGSGDFDEGGAA